MNVCQRHWDALRGMIHDHDLSHLIAPSAVIAAEQTQDQARRGDVLSGTEATPANFEPLMFAFWRTGSMVMEAIARAGGDGMYLLGQGPEDPIEGYGGKGKGRTWPRCGICYLGLAHELTCRDRRCTLPKKDGYAFMLKQAADEARAKAEELGLVT